jgi:acetyl esterase/lipase
MNSFPNNGGIFSQRNFQNLVNIIGITFSKILLEMISSFLTVFFLILFVVFWIYAYIRIRKYPLMKGHKIFSLIQIPFFALNLRVLNNPLQHKILTRKSVDPDVSREIIKIPGYNGGEIEVSIFQPNSSKNDNTACCLLYFHGGGFLTYETNMNYKLCCLLAKKAECKIFFVHYRLATTHPFPVPVEDCYSALLHVHAHAALYRIDPSKIAVGGDSAGGCLSAAVSLMARDRGGPAICLQLLMYPCLGPATETMSMTLFVDSPIINPRNMNHSWALYLRDGDFGNIQYAKPLQAADFSRLPRMYIEVEEFDCLRDEGLEYAKKLRDS